MTPSNNSKRLLFLSLTCFKHLKGEEFSFIFKGLFYLWNVVLVNEEESKKIKWSLYGQVAKLLKSSRLRYEETILFLFLLQNRWGGG